MNNFTAHQQQEIRTTAVRLSQIANHPAYPFLLKTYNEIIDQYELLKEFNLSADVMRPEVFWIQKSYMINMLTALNLRIDAILRESSF